MYNYIFFVIKETGAAGDLIEHKRDSLFTPSPKATLTCHSKSADTTCADLVCGMNPALAQSRIIKNQPRFSGKCLSRYIEMY